MLTLKRLATVALLVACYTIDMVLAVLNPVRQGEVATAMEADLASLIKRYSDEDTADSYATMQRHYSR